MLLQELFLKEENAETVLKKMAFTIDPNKALPMKNGYTNGSCFGKVAHYLKTNDSGNDYIMIFGIKGADQVTHTCLYSDSGKEVVDTFDGEIVHNGEQIVYNDYNGKQHELLASIKVSDFRKRFLSH